MKVITPDVNSTDPKHWERVLSDRNLPSDGGDFLDSSEEPYILLDPINHGRRIPALPGLDQFIDSNGEICDESDLVEKSDSNE